MHYLGLTESLQQLYEVGTAILLHITGKEIEAQTG